MKKSRHLIVGDNFLYILMTCMFDQLVIRKEKLDTCHYWGLKGKNLSMFGKIPPVAGHVWTTFANAKHCDK